MPANLTDTLQKHKYLLFKLNTDTFNRQNGIVTDFQGQKYFFKSVAYTNTFAYQSLISEGLITKYLSEFTSKNSITAHGYKFQTPVFHQFIQTSDRVILLTKYIPVKNLLTYQPDFQYKIIKALFALYTKLISQIISLPTGINTYYYYQNMIILATRNLIKSINNSPKNIVKLFQIYLTLIKSGIPKNQPTGLVHADINFSNILVKNKTIYLTDWEQAGCGFYPYSLTGPYCISISNSQIKKFIVSFFSDNPFFNKLYIPFRLLTLFSQKLLVNDPRRIRDEKLLNQLCQT